MFCDPFEQPRASHCHETYILLPYVAAVSCGLLASFIERFWLKLLYICLALVEFFVHIICICT